MLMPMRFPRVAFTTALVVGACAAIAAQQPGPELLAGRWPAHWIRPADAPPKGFGVYHFRKTFDLAGGAAAVRRPRHRRQPLRALRERPARADRTRARRSGSLAVRDTGHRAAALRAGPNVIAAVVWNFAEDAPMAQVTHETGLPRCRATATPKPRSTPTQTWKAVRERRGVAAADRSRRRSSTSTSSAAQASRWMASRYPWGWEPPEFDDTSWTDAERDHDWRPARRSATRRRAGCWCRAPFR